MSKAFVKDDGDEHEPPDEPEDPQPVGPQYISRDGYQKLASELEHLWKVERPRVTSEVEAAAAQGDRSENAEYIYGKKRLREIDRRMRYLAKRLERVTVVTATDEQRDTVFFGASVTVLDEEGESFTYRLVGTDEIDLANRCISIASPVGKALLGKHVGDEVVVKRPKGEATLVVSKIRY